MNVGPYTVEPTEVIDRIDGQWAVWECEVALPDGRTVMGTIQGDGHLWAPETLTDENGDDFPA